jgi:hypothetical protein
MRVHFLSVVQTKYKEYRVTKKPLRTWWLQYKKHAQSDCFAADRQGQGDTRLTLMRSVIPNSNYIIW